MRSRLRSPIVALAALALILGACARGTGAGSASASGATSSGAASASAVASGSAQSHKLTIAHTSAGDALAGEDGKTLYILTKDTGGTSTCNGGCAQAWPPFVLKNGEQALAGDGVSGTIGTITRDDGSKQVTYDGRPVYYYAKDTKAGDATGQGVGGVWFIADPTGAVPSGGSASASASAAASSSGYHY